MEYLLDIIIIVLFAIFLIVGFFRNPVMSTIHLILFIPLTYLFSFLIDFISPTIYANVINMSVEDTASYIASALVQANNEIISGSSQSGIDFITFPEYMLSVEYYTKIVYALLNSLSFILGSIISYLFSYCLSWAIYMPIKKKALLTREKYKENSKKVWFKLSSTFVNAILGFFFISFTLSPYQTSLNSYNEVKSDVYVVQALLSDREKLNNVFNAIDDVKRVNETLSYVEEDVNNLTFDANEINDEITFLIDGVREIETRYKSAKNNVYLISDLTLRGEILSYINTLDPILAKIDPYISKLLNYSNLFDDFISDVLYFSDDIKEIKTTLEDSLDKGDDYIDIYLNIPNEIDKYMSIVEEYDKYFISSNWFNPLISINWGFGKVEEAPFEEEIVYFADDLVAFFNDNLNVINEFVSSIEELDEINNIIDENYAIYEEYLDKAIALINEYNVYADSIKDELQNIDKILTIVEDLLP